MPLVLIVDDDTSVIETFGRMLSLEGYEVLTAVDTETALRTVETSHPDAILLDLRMPLIDGITFLRRLRGQEEGRHRTPVAIITGDYFARETLGPELSELDADLYFKPVWLADLVAIAQRLLSKPA